MNNRETRLTDLPYDILRLIMMLVAQSPNGAATFARAVSSCRTLKEFAADADILKVVEFENVRLFGIHESFWDENSLLQKCWDAGNERAYNVIWIKIIDVGAFEHMTASSKYVLVRIKDIVRVGDGFRFSNFRRIANIPLF